MKGQVLIIILIILICGCVKQTPKMGQQEEIQLYTNQGGDTMKFLFIVAQQDFRDEELEIPKDIVENAGHQVDVASITTDTAKGKLGMIVQPDLAVSDANLDNYNMVVVIGGPGAPDLANYPEVIGLLKQAKEKDMFIGAICIAPTILAKAGILNGAKATVWNSALDKTPIETLEQHGATYVDESVVIDGKIITANGPRAAEDFGNGILDLTK
ncbi:DJ-1/PfpI family protein [Candidatus Woesearchaeota archaeon]|nr:DJ-1/PfpI family protein [Candidatus Woesearchaeota archaeon]